LVSIKTFLQLLPERRDDPEFFTSFFEVATAEMRRMERLLDVVLDQARPGSGSDEPVDAGPVLESAGELVRHRADKHRIELLCEAAPDLPAVAIADDALRQVVLNLALNAIDATPDGGSVQLRAIADGDGVTIAVSDNGPGVPEALRQRVFEPFFTTRNDRTGGLGLAISRRVVEAAGGHIAVGESDAGGAEFRVRLPAANEDATGGATTQATSPPNHSAVRRPISDRPFPKK
jgi:signal transduction histidine kinase